MAADSVLRSSNSGRLSFTHADSEPVFTSPDENYISAIPPELLGRIFQLAQPTARPESEDKCEEPDRIPPPGIPVEVVASHVSGYWRKVALGMGPLWREINIRHDVTMEKLRTYLARSGNALLHIRLDLIQGPWDIAVLTETVDLLFSHILRWGRLTIHSTIETSDMPVVSRLYDVSAPQLEHLGLCIDDVDAKNLKSVRRADFEQILTKGCPRLSVLRLRGLSMHFFRPPLTNITTLHLEQTRGLFMGYTRFKHMLTASPALAHLSIHDTIIDEWEEEWPVDSVSCISVPSLISLRISIPGTLQHIFSDVLISISAPRLESLVLKQVAEVHLDRFFHLPGVSVKFPSLRSLTFYDFDYRSGERLAKMCTAFPSITEFTCIHTPAYPPRILEMMAGRSIAPLGAPTVDPWPTLRTLTTNIDADDLELLRLVVERRRDIGHPLRFLRVHEGMFEYTMDEEDEETLAWLEDNMTVERFLNVGRWPPGSDYDPDDTFFLEL
ncbi:hypothetical protein DFH07DRAFT_390644 [Mycena maculata]|uniref:F-box domain-containing protein n=1 Tax=Mycena maculata TaxID=230809 RepID=A0AAD7KB33_9AGAR|nr:hypothetical protein DFH07DRAFT_390644 [Mycena maculata]